MTAQNLNQNVRGNNNIIAGAGDIHIAYTPQPFDADEHRSLLVLRKEVRRFWIKGVLENSLHKEAVLQLDKTIMAEAVEHPWGRVLELPDQGKQSIAPEKRLVDIFDEMGRYLLILGDPGSGKTFSLLELARDLIARAEEDSIQPIPVILNLSSWTEKEKSLLEWAIDELQAKYHVPRRIGQALIKKNYLVLLLDGLDEVAFASRLKCAEAINELIPECMSGVVVCSRYEEYISLGVILTLNGAIYIQPLTPDQVGKYLAMAGEGLEGLRHAINQDSALQSLANSPLMLSVMSIAYHRVPARAIIMKSDVYSVRQRHSFIFDAYVSRMFERKGMLVKYSKEQIEKWLFMLARKMDKQSESIFLVENLQPSWLRRGILHFIYVLGSRIVDAISVFLFLALFRYAISYLGRHNSPIANFSETKYLLHVLSDSALKPGMVAGVILSFVDFLVSKVKALPSFAKRQPVGDAVRVCVVYLFAGVGWYLILQLLVDDTYYMPFSYYTGGPVLYFVFLFGQRVIGQDFNNDIQTVKAITFSMKGLTNGAVSGSLISLLLLPILALLIGQPILISKIGKEVSEQFAQSRQVIRDEFQRINARIISRANPEKKREIELFAPESEYEMARLDHYLDYLKKHVQLDPEEIAELKDVQERARVNQAKFSEEFDRKIKKHDGIIALITTVLTDVRTRGIWFLVLVGALIGACIGGVRKINLATKGLFNRGIKLTLRNSILGLFIGGGLGFTLNQMVVSIPLLLAKKFDLMSQLSDNWYGDTYIAAHLAVIFFVWYGGLDVIHHGILRIMLYLSGYGPLNYVGFLDAASQLIFLRQVGSGYIFIHRLLLEHFANKAYMYGSLSESKD